jgi:hypothetical protein
MNKLEKFGKKIQYSIGNESSWLHIEDGPWSWLYITKSTDLSKTPAVGRIMSDFRIEPTFVNRKSMFDLLNHFGCEKSKDVYRKSQSV